jgi:hypothetical protein
MLCRRLLRESAVVRTVDLRAQTRRNFSIPTMMAGEKLNGNASYKITFGRTRAAVNGFWSLTLYSDKHLFHPKERLSPVPIAATMALEMIGPMPGTLIRRSHPASRLASSSISLDKPSMRSSSRC